MIINNPAAYAPFPPLQRGGRGGGQGSSNHLVVERRGGGQGSSNHLVVERRGAGQGSSNHFVAVHFVTRISTSGRPLRSPPPNPQSSSVR